MSRARRFADKGNLHSLVLNATDGSASDAGEKVLLDGTDTSASNAGFTILLEDATGNADVRITSQLENGVFNFILFITTYIILKNIYFEKWFKLGQLEHQKEANNLEIKINPYIF